MKNSEKKEKLVNELSHLYKKIDVNRLYGFPNQKDNQHWLADVASVLKNLDENDYHEFVRLSKTVGLSGSREERKKAAQEINQFLARKTAEWSRYDFSSLDVIDNSPKLMFGEAGRPGQPGGGGTVYINGQVVNITDSARISADGGRSYSTHGNNSPIIQNIVKIQNLVSQLESEVEQNYNASDKKEVETIIQELKISAIEGNENKFKRLGGILLTRGAEFAQIASLIVQLLVLSIGVK
jgi:hypothetical protein